MICIICNRKVEVDALYDNENEFVVVCANCTEPKDKYSGMDIEEVIINDMFNQFNQAIDEKIPLEQFDGKIEIGVDVHFKETCLENELKNESIDHFNRYIDHCFASDMNESN